jgi:hypothetical protein
VPPVSGDVGTIHDADVDIVQPHKSVDVVVAVTVKVPPLEDALCAVCDSVYAHEGRFEVLKTPPVLLGPA